MCHVTVRFGTDHAAVSCDHVTFPCAPLNVKLWMPCFSEIATAEAEDVLAVCLFVEVSAQCVRSKHMCAACPVSYPPPAG